MGSGISVAGVPCPCCGARIEAVPAFVHPAVPVLLNVLAASEREAREAPSGRLELYECPACGLVFNRAFEGVPYGEDYFLDATLSGRYRRHLDDVADRLAARMGPRASFSVAEVGAGQGTFLAHLGARLGGRVARAHGFDPAFRAAQAALPGNVAVTASAPSAGAVARLDFHADVVATRHVVEHVPHPAGFLVSFREFFPGPFELLVETPDVGHTLRRGLLHDFCYEHCSMSSAGSLAEALRRGGYESVTVENAFDGEYLLAFAHAPAASGGVGSAKPPRTYRRDGESPRLADVARRFVPEHRERLRQAHARGPVAIWGGAGKGALFAHLVDPDRALVEFVVDIHPAKQGFYLPGAGHRVVAPEEARRAGVRTVFVANPTYAAEVAASCEALGLGARVECVGDVPAG